MVYSGQTAPEMVNLLKNAYRKVGGDEFDFKCEFTNSDDPRLNTMGSFELDVLYLLVKEILG